MKPPSHRSANGLADIESEPVRMVTGDPINTDQVRRVKEAGVRRVPYSICPSRDRPCWEVAESHRRLPPDAESRRRRGSLRAIMFAIMLPFQTLCPESARCP
jgi:hypothetical protein